MWHTNVFGMIPQKQVQEALSVFKSVVIPPDNELVRLEYIELRNHGSLAILQLSAQLKQESLLEKLSLKPEDNDSENSQTQDKLF